VGWLWWDGSTAFVKHQEFFSIKEKLMGLIANEKLWEMENGN